MSIVGNGAIAKALKDSDRDDLFFFASGVSNSGKIDQKEYIREKDLLLSDEVWDYCRKTKKRLVYFSSLGVFDEKSYYYDHKREMEWIVKNNFFNYAIVRLGNITWQNDNPYTIINFFKNKLEKGEEFEVRDEYRYLVDKDEFLYWIRKIPSATDKRLFDSNCEINIPGRRIKVEQIIEEIKAGKL